MRPAGSGFEAVDTLLDSGVQAGVQRGIHRRGDEGCDGFAGVGLRWANAHQKPMKTLSEPMFSTGFLVQAVTG